MFQNYFFAKIISLSCGKLFYCEGDVTYEKLEPESKADENSKEGMPRKYRKCGNSVNVNLYWSMLSSKISPKEFVVHTLDPR